MRTLLYVPIIHEEADLGSLGAALDRASGSLVGKARWARHKEIVERYWATLGQYMASLETPVAAIYQDGLAAEGEMARKVIEEASRRGSRNYQLVLELMARGALPRKTEDISLLVQEGQQLMKVAQRGTGAPGVAPISKRSKDLLMRRRDRYMATRINETLEEGETGVLFVGAYHDVLPRLKGDIDVVPLKSRQRVLEYFEELLAGHDEARMERLATYLVAPIHSPDQG